VKIMLRGWGSKSFLLFQASLQNNLLGLEIDAGIRSPDATPSHVREQKSTTSRTNRQLRLLEVSDAWENTTGVRVTGGAGTRQTHKA